MSESYEKLRRLVQSVENDVAKAASGNNAATTRVRKVMQEAKGVCGDIRKEMLESRLASK